MSLGSLTLPFLLLRSLLSQLSVSKANMSSTEASAPVIAGIHHLKFPVSDIDASLDWYTSVLSASRQPELDHFTASGTRYAVELKVPGMAQGVLELRQFCKPIVLALVCC